MKQGKIALVIMVLLLAGGVALPTNQLAHALTMEEILPGKVLSATSKVKTVKLPPLGGKKTVPVTVTVISPFNGTVLNSGSIITDASGNVTVKIDASTTIPSSVNFRIKPQGRLSRMVSNVDLTSEAVENVSLNFVSGDANGDDIIDVRDKAAVAQAWGSGDASADLNGDGVVNSFDMLPVVTNMGQRGE